MILYSLSLIPIIMAIFIYLMPFKHYKQVMIGTQSLLLGLSLLLFLRIDVLHEGKLVHHLSRYDANIGINLMADSISASFLVLTCFIFLAMFIYAYQKPFMNRLFIFLFMVLEALILTVFLVQDLFSLYALIEVSTIVVSVLIMYKKDATALYDGTIYLFTNMLSMTFFLIGVGYIYKIFGTLDLLQLGELVTQVDNPRTLILPYAFIMTAVGLKSALMPLFSWLPHAHGSHSAPYIVSAVLSGLYIKGSLYIFIRLQHIFGDVLNTHELFIFLGFITAIIAMLLALAQEDIKLLLAYSTVSQIGLIIFGLSLANDYSYYGSIYHIINHAIFKSLLFLCAGLIIDRYKTRRLQQIRGLFRTMPWISAMMILGLLGITGAPLFNGSISKYLIQRGVENHLLIEYGIMVLNIASMTYCIKLSQIFFGDKEDLAPVPIHQKSIIGLLGILCLIGGLFGHYLVGVFFQITITWSLVNYLEKFLIYLLSAGIAMAFYQFIYKPSHLFSTIREVELTFNELVLSIVTFFFGLLTYLMITVH